MNKSSIVNQISSPRKQREELKRIGIFLEDTVSIKYYIDDFLDDLEKKTSINRRAKIVPKKLSDLFKINIELDYDKIYLVYDLDTLILSKSKKANFEKKLKGIKNKYKTIKFIEIKSNPCAEILILYHFIDKNGNFNKYDNLSKIIKEINRREIFKKPLDSRNIKSINNIYKKTSHKLEEAMKVSKNRVVSEDSIGTEIFKMFEEFSNF